jgi:hypothetical protein
MLGGDFLALTPPPPLSGLVLSLRLAGRPRCEHSRRSRSEPRCSSARLLPPSSRPSRGEEWRRRQASLSMLCLPCLPCLAALRCALLCLCVCAAHFVLRASLRVVVHQPAAVDEPTCTPKWAVRNSRRVPPMRAPTPLCLLSMQARQNGLVVALALYGAEEAVKEAAPVRLAQRQREGTAPAGAAAVEGAGSAAAVGGGAPPAVSEAAEKEEASPAAGLGGGLPPAAGEAASEEAEVSPAAAVGGGVPPAAGEAVAAEEVPPAVADVTVGVQVRAKSWICTCAAPAGTLIGKGRTRMHVNAVRAMPPLR